MNIIVCVDDRMGMLFNHRRQSQDQALRRELLTLTGDSPLHMNSYTAKQFSREDPARIRVSEDFLDTAGPEDWCFVEDRPLLPCLDRIHRLVVCFWNRTYPGDLTLDLDLRSFQLVDSRDFPGSSHEKITLEVYEK